MKNTKYIIAAIALTIVMFFVAIDPQAAVAQIDSGRNEEARQQNYYGQGGGQSVERLASRMERFMKMQVEVVRNQMQLNSLLGGLIELEIKNAQNGRFTHISDSTYFDTRTAEIFKRPKP